MDKKQNQKSSNEQNLKDLKDSKPVETLNGKTREELEQKLADCYGNDWVIANKKMLDAQWEYIQSM